MERLLSSNANDPKSLEIAQRDFWAHSIVDITSFLDAELIGSVRQEVDRLTDEFGRRRDLKIKSTGDTPRRMNNVEFRYINDNSSLLADLYFGPELRDFLSSLVGEEVLICPYDPEKMVITKLAKSGDSHGWHWDDYSFAMIWVLDAPDPAKGGVLQCVPNTRWNREKPNLISQFLAQPIRTYHFPSGSVYLMKSDTTLHRVYPLTDASAQRTILNITYASRRDLEKAIDHSSMEELFSPTEEAV